MGVEVETTDQTSQIAALAGHGQALAERVDRRQPPGFVATMGGPLGARRQRLAEIVGEAGEANRQIGAELRGAVQDHQGVAPRIDLRMVLGRLRHAEQRIDFRKDHRQRADLAQQPFLVHTLDGVDDAELMQRLERPGQHPEGWFLPDTYHFPRGTRDIVVLRRALQAMERHLEQNWERRRPDLPLDSPYEALILASIVEKETGIPEERARIAGVFVRRLERGMRLQTDPTVIYGMGDAFDGNIRRRDLRTDTPYNTYTRGGLPPTPIALPSAEAVTAVMHPAAGEALYFVSRGDGSHVFSATLQEHNRAVRRYQLNRP